MYNFYKCVIFFDFISLNRLLIYSLSPSHIHIYLLWCNLLLLFLFNYELENKINNKIIIIVLK